MLPWPGPLSIAMHLRPSSTSSSNSVGLIFKVGGYALALAGAFTPFCHATIPAFNVLKSWIACVVWDLLLCECKCNIVFFFAIVCCSVLLRCLLQGSTRC